MDLNFICRTIREFIAFRVAAILELRNINLTNDINSFRISRLEKLTRKSIRRNSKTYGLKRR